MEYFVKEEASEVSYYSSEVKCIICLETQTDSLLNQDKERWIYESLINRKIQNDKINVTFCKSCCHKLAEVDIFKAQCNSSLMYLEESIEKVPLKDEILEPLVMITPKKDESNKKRKVLKLPKRTQLTKKSQNRSTITVRKVTKDIDRSGKYSFYCSICNKTFDNTLRYHLKKYHLTVDSSGIYSCNECKRYLKREETAMNHFKMHHLKYETAKECNECGKKLESAQEVNEHQYFHLRGKYECHFCGEKKASRHSIKQHIQRLHLRASLCKYCQKLFLDEKEYESHMAIEEEKHKGEEEKSFLCNLCGAVFKKYAALLSKHYIQFHSEAKYLCEICGKAFGSNAWKNAHVKSAHGEKKLACNICGNAFSTKTLLRNHKRNIHEKARVMCTICGKEVPGYTLKAHMQMSHSNERKFKCPFCTEAFKCNASLKKHSFTHSKTRPFNCLQCPTGYYMISYLKGHYERSHGIIYTSKETYENCRREKPQLLDVAKI